MRSWQAWSVFALCAVLIAGAVALFGRTVLALDRAQVQARVEAEIDDRARLALWRMESAVVPLIAQEAARPYDHYLAVREPVRGARLDAPAEDEIEASPLLPGFVPYVRLHFQLAPDGTLTSPQVPGGADRERLLAAGLVGPAQLAEAERRLESLRRVLAGHSLIRTLLQRERDLPAGMAAPLSAPAEPPVPPPGVAAGTFGVVAGAREELRNTREFEVRRESVEPQVMTPSLPAPEGGLFRTARLEEQPLLRFWSGEQLFLARRLVIDGRIHAQGCWLDWGAIVHRFQEEIRDLLPNARITTASEGSAAGERGLRLAALPALLAPGDLPIPDLPSGTSPVRLSLIVACAAVAAAALMAALLVHVMLTFAERRGAFVSAVTHELRTPLTTLRMYTDLLAEGRIRDESKRRAYLETLRREADRLGTLVENVLAWSRIESARRQPRVVVAPLGELLDRGLERARERVRLAGLDLRVAAPPELRATRVRADGAAVEQVLFNLVDNACKYAGDPARPIEVSLENGARGGAIRVRDHGPGLEKGAARRLFRPFHREDEAARAPGVGLGLALSRRLARGMGGDLEVERPADGGAAFVLRLRAEPA